MGYEQILYEIADGVATITLNRPEKLNAWTLKMGGEFEEAIGRASMDDAVRVILVTGAGRSFCAGADLSLVEAFAAPKEGAGEEHAEPPHSFNLYLPAMKKPVIAAVNEHAIGMGLALALYCDVRLATPATKMSLAFSKLGLIAEWGVAWVLPRIVGMSRALDLLYTSRTVEGAEALSLGLVDRIFTEESFTEEVRRYALHLASAVSPQALSVMRRQVYAGFGQTNAEAAEMAYGEMLKSFGSADCREGLAGFTERRAPKFSGR